MHYLFDEFTGKYLGQWKPDVDREKTIAVKRTIVVMGSVPPNNCTTIAPPKDAKECWFIGEKWTEKHPTPKSEKGKSGKSDKNKKPESNDSGS